MTESNPMKDWQLQGSPEGQEQWQLLDTEQELPADLRLSQDPSSPVQNWQPIEYAERKASGGRNWLLSSLIIIAMLAVVGYIAFLGYNGGGLTGTVQAPSPEPAAQDPSVVVMDATPSAEVPTAAPTVAPTATLPPAPTATATPRLVDQVMATIDSEYGLNARREPTADSEVIQLLDNGATYKVLEQGAEWTQIVLDDGTSAWIAATFAQYRTEQVPAPPDAEPVVDAPAPDAATPADEGDVASGATPQTTGIVPPLPFTDVIPAGPAVIIEDAAGINARTAPATDGDIVLTVPQGAALPATGVSEDGDWLRIELPSGDGAWMFQDVITTSGAIATLPVLSAAGEPIAVQAPAAEQPATPPVDSTADVTTTTALTETVGATEPVTGETAAIDVVPTAIIDNLFGGIARETPLGTAARVRALDANSEWPVLGRTAANDWILVDLGEDESGWLLIGTVLLNVDVGTLPVVE